MTKLMAIIRHLLEHRRLPLALALAAIVVMLPALRAGLLCDDLIQRLNQLTPAELPPRAFDTGFVANDSGSLSTVANHLFDLVHQGDAAARARDYGIAPWWSPTGWTAALWRPVTAFTHWLDYRLYPHSPELMHAHSIAWYALVVFLVATLYRRVSTAANGSRLGGQPPPAGAGDKMRSGLFIAGVAGFLWLLDGNTYFPVMFVANRGFIVALAFGMLCWHAHLRWRTGQSRKWMWLSALCLALSLLADEGGASTLAFLMAYALVLDSGGWRSRLASFLPAAAVVLVWRTVYVASGYGVGGFSLYVDPGYAPLAFLNGLIPRANGVLGGQLTGVAPELALALNATWQTILALFFAGFTLACALAFWPILRRDKLARFWAVVMLLAVVPAATVFPLTKNLGFVAVGAFGVIASFLVAFATAPVRAALPALLRPVAWCVAVCLLLAHLFAPAVGRIFMARISPLIPEASARVCSFDQVPEIGGRDVVVINDPTLLTIIVPFYRAYSGQPLPRTVRILVPGSAPFQVSRPDASTLLLTAKGSDLFDCPDFGPIRAAYLCKEINQQIFGVGTWQTGDRVTNKQFVAEILEVSPRGAPRSVAFHFDKPLESDRRVWLFFDWNRRAHSSFVLPKPGETIEVAGAEPPHYSPSRPQTDAP
ncbi:MAG: hypothetical protein ABSG04_06820 [Verrucomicrobiota bacterium]